MLTKAERLRLFLHRLAAAPAAASHDEALALIEAIVNAVEDEHSGVVANPAKWRTDGRMYAPQSDHARAVADRPGVTAYRSVSHRTLIASNGAIAIIELRTESLLIEKPGGDGKLVPAPG
jgi:hypothetical protein